MEEFVSGYMCAGAGRNTNIAILRKLTTRHAAQDLARPKFYQHICIVIHGVQRISLCEGPSDRVLLEGRFELRADPVCKVTIDMSTISGAY